MAFRLVLDSTLFQLAWEIRKRWPDSSSVKYNIHNASLACYLKYGTVLHEKGSHTSVVITWLALLQRTYTMEELKNKFLNGMIQKYVIMDGAKPLQCTAT